MKTSFLKLPHVTYKRFSPEGLVIDRIADTETRLLLLEAKKLGISWRVIPGTDTIELRLKDHFEYLRNRTASSNHSPGTKICTDKSLTRAILSDALLPITRGYLVRESDSLEFKTNIFEKLKKPLVVKPAHGTHGADVFLEVRSLSKFISTLEYLFSNVERDTELTTGGVMVEETAQGKEYRIIATREKVLAVMYREPASVTGDGKHTIAELITIKNQDPMRNLSQDMYPHITLDREMIHILKGQVYTPDSIPNVGQKVSLRLVSNIMAGGDAYDVTDDVHESVKKIAIAAIRAIPGLTFGGLDFMTIDIHADQSSVKCAIIEVNSAPEFAMHDFPMNGKKRGVAQEILKLMFPELREQAKREYLPTLV